MSDKEFKIIYSVCIVNSIQLDFRIPPPKLLVLLDGVQFVDIKNRPLVKLITTKFILVLVTVVNVYLNLTTILRFQV